MGLIADAFSPSRRASTGDTADVSLWTAISGMVRKTTSGESVSPTRALTISAYFAAIRVISEDIAKLPVHVYRELTPRGKVCLPNDPVGRIIMHQPNTEMTAFTFRETMTQWAAGWGNGYAEIVRDVAGRVRELWPIHPSRVRILRDPGGRLIYRVTADYDPTNPANERFTAVDMRAEDIFHLRGMGNGVVGYSVAAFAAETLGVALATQTFAAAFFANGTQGGGILTHPGTLKPEARTNLRESWNKQYGAANKAYRVKLLEEGITFTNTFVPPDEAQFVETREFQIEDIARWFRIAQHKIGHLKRSTFGNIEHQSVEHVVDCLMPWATRWEQEVKRSLIGIEPLDIVLKHDFNGLLRGDSNARANFYRTLGNLGALSPNDIREMEDENPIPGTAGDQYYMQTNMASLDRISAGTAAAAPAGRPAKDSAADAAEIGERTTQALAQVATLRPVLEANADRVLRKLTLGLQRAEAKGKIQMQWALSFFDEIAANWLDSIGPTATALNQSTANLLGVAAHPFNADVWTSSWNEHRDAVIAAGGSAGLPPGMTPAATADEIIKHILLPYGITP